MKKLQNYIMILSDACVVRIYLYDRIYQWINYAWSPDLVQGNVEKIAEQERKFQNEKQFNRQVELNVEL